MRTREKGSVTVGANNGAAKANHAMLPALYEKDFRCTVYVWALESDWGGAVTNPGDNGLANSYRIDFLKAVRMQGCGLALNGDKITIDWSQGNPMGSYDTTFFKIGEPTTASGRPLTNRTIAVDPKVIPLGATVTIDPDSKSPKPIPNGGANRSADDTGGKIKGYHIDIFAGAGKAVAAGWPNPNLAVRLENY